MTGLRTAAMVAGQMTQSILVAVFALSPALVMLLPGGGA